MIRELRKSRTPWALAALLVAAACGTGTDGKPVAPPTSPAPEPLPPAPPPPPPAPLDRPTGIRVVEVGQTFIVWAWDPVEGATHYHVWVFLAGSPEAQRGDIIVTRSPMVRAEGLEPGEFEIWVRAVREMDSGRTVGGFSAGPVVHTQREPRVCTDERERAINFGRSRGHSPVLIHEWSGEPFRFYWDSSIPDDLKGYAQSAVELVERLSDEIESQIGYPILEVAGWVDVEDRGFGFNDTHVTPCEGVRPGGIVATVHPNDTSVFAGAMPRCGVIYWTAGGLNDGWEGCPACGYHAATHEIFHLFGFSHSPNVEGQQQSPPGEGVHMTTSLSAGRPVIWPRPELAGATWG